jgi:hypothetical protein
VKSKLKTAVPLETTGNTVEIKGKKPQAQGKMGGQQQTQEYPADPGLRDKKSEQSHQQGYGHGQDGQPQGQHGI